MGNEHLMCILTPTWVRWNVVESENYKNCWMVEYCVIQFQENFELSYMKGFKASN